MKLSKKNAAGLLAAASLAITGCSSDTGSSNPAAQPSDGTSQEQGTNSQVNEVVDAEKFATVIKQPHVVTLDVRSPAEFDQGHIEGAVNMDVDGANFTQEVAKLDPKVTYAVYCRTGRRSATAVGYMSQQGFTSLYDLSGGIGSWQAAGYTLV